MFESRFEKIWKFSFLPKFSNLRIMMLPIRLGDEASYPDYLQPYSNLLGFLSGYTYDMKGEVFYLTIDEKKVKKGESHRRKGLHVDGVYKNGGGAWGGGGSWGANGFITISSTIGCQAFNQRFKGYPGDEGECDHLEEQLDYDNMHTLEPHTLYWMSPLCVHRSMIQTQDIKRQFVRLSFPSNAPWFEGYTENPKVSPTGPILSRRIYL